MARTTLASDAGLSSFRPTPTRWSTAKVRPTATPTCFPAYDNQPPTPVELDETASLATTLLASTSSAPAASHRTSRLRQVSAWMGSYPPLQDPCQPSSLFASSPATDFHLLGSRTEHLGAPTKFVGPTSTRDSTAGPLVGADNAAVNTGAPPGSASRPPVVSPLSTIAATEPPTSGLTSSRTRQHATATAVGIPRPTADYVFGRRPQPAVFRRPTSTRRPPTPPVGAQPRLPQTTPPPAAAPTPLASPAPTLPRLAPPSTSSPPSPSTPVLPHPNPVVDHNNDTYPLARIERYTYEDWARTTAEPVCYAAIRFLSLDSPSPPPTDLLDFIPSAQRPLLDDVLALAS